MNGGTSPLEREILTHYWTTPGPYRGGSENWTPLHAAIVRHFIDQGLLIAGPPVKPNEEAMRVYMEALSAVPLPVRRWVIP